MPRGFKPPFDDALLALLLVALGQAEAWSGILEGPKLLAVPVAALAAAPLAWRRRAPLSVAVVVMATLAVRPLIDVPLNAGISSFLGVLVALYSVAAHADDRRAVAGLVAGLALAWASVYASNTNDYVFASLVTGAPWLAGRALRSRRLAADSLAERAVQLEREREEKALRAVAEERSRIARDLHDVVAHGISVMTVQAAGVRRVLRPEQEREREALLSVEQTGREALAEMRRLLGILRQPAHEPELAPQPGLERLDTLVHQAREAGLPVELAIEGERLELPPGIELSAYRIVQEALTNARKHARPTRTSVDVRYRSDAVEIEVVNDGAGDVPADGTGHGLVGMRERVSLYGGEVESGRVEGGRFRVRARLPVKRSPA